jgi:23S rRNA (guanosine2251-2'-O)-methyltransferase
VTPKTDMLEGFNAVGEAIAAGRRDVHRVLIAEKDSSRRASRLAAAANRRNIAVEKVPENRWRSLLKARPHQGVAAEAEAYPMVPASIWTEAVKSQPVPPFLLLLDQVQDPGNLGAIVRTALCAGVHGIIVPKDRSAPLSPAVAKASAGAIEHLRIARVNNLVRTMESLKTAGFWITGLIPKVDSSLFDMDFGEPTALVIGGEGTGLRPLVRRTCDRLAAIPQAGRFDSLNAAAAAAVALYEVFRQRRGGAPA